MQIDSMVLVNSQVQIKEKNIFWIFGILLADYILTNLVQFFYFLTKSDKQQVIIIIELLLLLNYF